MKRLITITTIALMSLAIFGCSTQQTQNTTPTETMTVSAIYHTSKNDSISTPITTASVAGATLSPSSVIASPTSGKETDKAASEVISDSPVVLTGSVTKITLGSSISISGTGARATGNTVYITAKGNYSVSGTLTNGQIVINCDNATINLELAGVNITNPTGPAILSADAKMTNIILKEGTVNTLTDGSGYTNAELKAPLFCEDSMTVKGTGTLNVTGKFKHGIASDDLLTIAGGKINVLSAVTDGLHANDGIVIDGGSLNITASSDGIESEQAVTINGGELEISAYDDGIHAETDLTVNKGNINVSTSYEGIEGKNAIYINGGSIRLKCDDDSVNAGTNVVINDGYLYADCRGDGLDSNGDMTINGGTVLVFSADTGNGPIDIGDRGASFVINGGTVLVGGGSMGISVSQSSKQHSIWISSRVSAETLLNISDQSGKEMITFSTIKSCSLLFYSSDKLSSGTSYNIYSGGSHSGKLADNVYSNGSYTAGSLMGSVTMSSISASLGNVGGGGPGGFSPGGWNDFGPGEGDRRPPGGWW